MKGSGTLIKTCYVPIATLNQLYNLFIPAHVLHTVNCLSAQNRDVKVRMTILFIRKKITYKQQRQKPFVAN